jgi:cell division protease FtsH
VHADDIKLAPEVDLGVIARRTPGFVGADLANLLNEAALLAARRDHEAVQMADLDEAIDRVVAGLEKKNRVIHEQEKEIVAYHEAGHALVAERMQTADPVHKISIIPRGVAALGYTQQLPTDERYLIRRQELLDRICVLLGGRAAEQLIYNEVSTGAANDLERASEIARRMVTEFGMSEAIGPVAIERKRRPAFLDVQDGIAPGGELSEQLAQVVDSEMRRILVEQQERAYRTLEKDRRLLEAITQRLLEKEVIDRAELREVMGLPPEPDETRPEVGHAPDEAAD